MKREKFALLALLAISLALVLFNSCSDKCKKVLCYNGAICIDGKCACQPGFEGDDCSLETREKFLGTFNVIDNCSVTGNAMYTVNISVVDTNVTMVLIANFNNDFSNNVYATISGATIKIPSQSPDLNGRGVSGTGIFSGSSVITWDYAITMQGGATNSCAGSVWTK